MKEANKINKWILESRDRSKKMDILIKLIGIVLAIGFISVVIIQFQISFS
jgi:hypothetical protein